MFELTACARWNLSDWKTKTSSERSGMVTNMSRHPTLFFNFYFKNTLPPAAMRSGVMVVMMTVVLVIIRQSGCWDWSVSDYSSAVTEKRPVQKIRASQIYFFSCFFWLGHRAADQEDTLGTKVNSSGDSKSIMLSRATRGQTCCFFHANATKCRTALRFLDFQHSRGLNSGKNIKLLRTQNKLKM